MRHTGTNSVMWSSDVKVSQTRWEVDINGWEMSEIFYEELMNVFAKANIPMDKIGNVYRKMDWCEIEKWKPFQKKRMLDKLYDKQRELLFFKLKKWTDVYLFDENTDKRGKFILKILIGVFQDLQGEIVIFKTI